MASVCKMLRSATLVLACVLLVSASVVQRPNVLSRLAEKDFLQRQMNIYNLFSHVSEPNIFKDQVVIAKEYNIENNLSNYKNVDAVKEFLTIYHHDILPKGEVFSILFPIHQQQAQSLFNVLYYAKDYDTFYKTLVWAREHVNDQMFVYAMSVAIRHRPDMQGITLPPLYEVYPEQFFPSEVIHMAHELKSHRFHNVKHLPHVQIFDDQVVIDSNYTGWYLWHNEEQKMSYYTEDIGLQLFYYSNHLDYPFWLGGEEFKLNKDRRGEMYCYKHMQLLARYYLERLSNGLGEIPVMTMNTPVLGFSPSLTYANGLVFPVRSNGYVPHNPIIMHYMEQMHQLEQRISDAVDSGYILTENGEMQSIKKPEGIEILGNMMEGNLDSKNLRYYKRIVNIALSMYGSGVVPLPMHRNHNVPSVLEHYQTAMRDPLFYQIYKDYMHYFVEYKNQLPPYTKGELMSSGVMIANVEVDKLMTYFEPAYTNISNLMYLDEHEVTHMTEKMHVLVRQMRITHKPFNTKITVKSEVAKAVYVKLFVGPKYDSHGLEIDLNENRFNFVEWDEFKYELKQGENVIARNSQDSVLSSDDPTSSSKIYQQIMQALDGAASFHLDMAEAQSDWPQRLMVPKGTKSGMPFIVYVHIGDFVEPKVPYGKGFDPAISSGVGSGARYPVDQAFGYPLDRPISHDTFHVPNMYMKEVMIYHKPNTDVNKALIN